MDKNGLDARALAQEVVEEGKKSGEIGVMRVFFRAASTLTGASFYVVQLGTYKNAEEVISALKAVCDVSGFAKDVIRASVLASEKTNLVLLVLSVAELGLEDGAAYAEVCAQAQKLGLQLCPAEVGPQLRLQYLDQPEGEWLDIALESSGGYENIFLIGNGYGLLQLDCRPSQPNFTSKAEDKFVFVVPCT